MVTREWNGTDQNGTDQYGTELFAGYSYGNESNMKTRPSGLEIQNFLPSSLSSPTSLHKRPYYVELGTTSCINSLKKSTKLKATLHKSTHTRAKSFRCVAFHSILQLTFQSCLLSRTKRNAPRGSHMNTCNYPIIF